MKYLLMSLLCLIFVVSACEDSLQRPSRLSEGERCYDDIECRADLVCTINNHQQPGYCRPFGHQ